MAAQGCADESFQGDAFDDDDEFLAEIEHRKELNRHVTTIEKRVSRQMTLDGDYVSNVDENGNEITYRTVENIVTFGPTHHHLDAENVRTFVYPTNFEVRDYQFDIVSKALFKNVLCALPTGLGKTFIASTVMLNFYRWTDTAKIIFMAPTRPLVAQQIKACYGITGIPSHDTAILLDKTKKNRAEIWESKRVFFATPQVVENDLKSGFVSPKDIVCLVIDEAHRAKGSYAYNNVVKFMKRFTSSFRILALTATPASDIDGVQELVDNLLISKVELRTENSLDTAKYMKKKDICRITCAPSEPAMDMIDLLASAAKPTLDKCINFKIYEVADPYKINAFVAMEASQKIVRNPTIAEGLKWMYYFLLQILAVVGQGLRRLNIYGVRNFYAYFHEKHQEFTAKWETKKSTNKYAADFYYHKDIKKLLKFCAAVIEKDDNLSAIGQGTSGLFSHTKFEHMIRELAEFFGSSANSDSRVIIFTEFRDSALEIVKVIDTYNTNHRRELKGELKPHVFIGQSKEKDKFNDTEFRRKAAPKKRGKKSAKQLEEEKEQKKQQEQDSKQRQKALLEQRTATLVGSSELAQENGMSQQQQKDVIEKFKNGFYNILVATSIGEEGLDIGEVDMIICFDSTSSPIKNIQRMGRTGRKRDGKIILLFSSNEESKFDTAMGGYDYIQKALATGENLKYEKSDRIIPKNIDPIVDKRFIEIPEENNELIDMAETESEEAFLKAATQATIGKKKKNSSKKQSKTDPKQKKLTKKFFMPDNVETGFQNASSLVAKFSNGVDVSKSITSERASSSKRPQDELKNSDPSAYISYSEIKKKQKTNGDSSLGSILSFDDDDDELESLLQKKSWSVQKDPQEDLLKEMVFDDSTISTAPIEHSLPKQRNRTLGTSNRKGSSNVIESLKRQIKERPFKPIIVSTSSQSIMVDDDDDYDTVSARASHKNSYTLPAEQKRNEPVNPARMSVVEQLVKIRTDQVVDPNMFHSQDGYLDKDELDVFYSKYNTPAVHIDDSFFEPKPLKDISCRIGHSTKMYKFLEFMSSDTPAGPPNPPRDA